MDKKWVNTNLRLGGIFPRVIVWMIVVPSVDTITAFKNLGKYGY